MFFLYLIALWAISGGAFQIAAALRLRKELTGEWLMVLGGIASMVFGVLLLLFPGGGALALVWWIATYAIVFGALLLGLALRLRKGNKEIRPHRAAEPSGKTGKWQVCPSPCHLPLVVPLCHLPLATRHLPLTLGTAQQPDSEWRRRKKASQVIREAERRSRSSAVSAGQPGSVAG